jgi:hypothetical protein
LVSGVAVTSGGIGIYVQGNTSFRAMGNVLRNNHVGSASDSLISGGIHDQRTDGTIIENNHIENLRLTTVDVNGFSSQGGIDEYGSINTSIRNNLVHNLRMNTANSSLIGILAAGSSSVTYKSSNVWIYNNKVWDITNGVGQSVEVTGIQASRVDSLKVDYNSVYLSQSGNVPATNGSSAVWFQSTNIYPTVRNNILVNTRDDAPYVSVAIRMDAATSLSDHNDLFVGSSGSANIAKVNTTLYKSLADWQGTLKDVHSVSMCPIFVTQALHIDTTNVASNALNNRATPIAGILYDFEGALRNATTPDIGADEFEKVVSGITKDGSNVPETFALMQNYPNPFNPATVISYQLPVNSYVTLKVYDLLGREVATLVNERKEAGNYSVQWNASGFATGMYLVRIQAGSFIDTKKVLLMK